MDENKEETNEQSPGTEYCIICSCGFNRDEYDTLDPMGQICIARCCGFTFHRACVSRYGYNFGLVKVKCPNCNGKFIILYYHSYNMSHSRHGKVPEINGRSRLFHSKS